MFAWHHKAVELLRRGRRRYRSGYPEQRARKIIKKTSRSAFRTYSYRHAMIPNVLVVVEELGLRLL